MKNRIHIKKGDNVVVISGKDKGKKGKVLSVGINKKTVLVEGINIATKHTKARRAGETGGIVHQEAPIDISNIMLVHEGKVTKIGYKIEGDKKVRVAKSTGKVID